MGFLAFFAVAVGGALGTCLRYFLSVALNPVFPTLPLGTLAVNLIGGLIIGLAIGVFGHVQTLPPELRLFVTSGFCGGLTTFSTFSAETVNLLMRQQYGWALALVSTHLLGSLAMTFVGIVLVGWLIKA